MIKGKKHFALKIVTTGDGGVGKTTLLHKYVNNKFIEDTSMTIGVQIHSKMLFVGEYTITLQIWDFGGQDRFRFILPNYMLGCKGALMLFDLTRMASTFNLEASWLSIIRKATPDLPVLLLGTKKDMVQDGMPTFDPNFGPEFAEKNKLEGFLEVSSKTGENVEEAFQLLTRKIMEKAGLDI
ncbi:MAG: Rab family GTPase [Candidatus Hodarchaeota archaeon]